MSDIPHTPVAVDVCGSDSGLKTVVEGAVDAANQYAVPCVLVGNEDQILSVLVELGAKENPLLTVAHAPEEITMDDSAATVLRAKQQSSMRVAFREVAEQRACAVVSAGNTGAMMAAGLSVFGTLPGIVRPAITTSIPNRSTDKLTILLDSGANVQCDARQLTQFAIMGTCFARMSGLDNPTVGVLSNGTESSKGTTVTREAVELIGAIEGLRSVGYVEGGDLSSGQVDVVVCDGFVGNIALKTIEGTAQMVVSECFGEIDDLVSGSHLSETEALSLKRHLKGRFLEKFNPAAYGGAPLLGLQRLAMVCHGSSDTLAITKAITLCAKLYRSGLHDSLRQELSEYDHSLCSDSPIKTEQTA